MSIDGSASPPAPELRPTDPSSSKEIRIVSARQSVPERVTEIWRNRELLGNLVATEIKVKYKNSALGLLWSMVSPAVMLAIYWFVFGIVLKNGLPNFVIFLFAGTLFWNFFNTGVQTATAVIVQRAGIVKKVSFPREILAMSAVGTAGVYMFFQAIVLVLFMVIVGNAPDWKLLWLLPLTLLAAALFATALGIALSAVNVYLRDMQHLIEVILMAWFWACPIVYSYWYSIRPTLSAHGLNWLYMLNPMTPVVMTSQRVIYAHSTVALTTPGHPIVQVLPPWHALTYLWLNLALIAIGALLTYLALAAFGRLEGNFAESL